MTRWDEMRLDILTFNKKLTASQFNLPDGTKTKKIRKQLKTKADVVQKLIAIASILTFHYNAMTPV